MSPEKTRIFISHAWEDKPLVRRLEKELQAAGVETWVDDSRTRGGDNLPERISGVVADIVDYELTSDTILF